MTNIIVFGAGGRAGRRVVAEAVARGHRVTAVVRDPARYPELDAVAGDVTDPDSVAELAVHHDVAVNAAVLVDVPAFFSAASNALVDGLGRAGVGRLVAIGIGTLLETAPGVAVHDAPGFPADGRAFSLGHAAGLAVLRDATMDWVMIAPPPVVLADSERTGRYRTGDTRLMSDGPFSYADLAVAVVDEAETPKHHRALIAVSY